MLFPKRTGHLWRSVKCDLNFPVGLNDSKQVTIGDFTFIGVPAKHNELERDEHGNSRFMGYVIKFGGHTIYHSGDTLWFDGMADLLKPFNVDLALLPVNGNDPCAALPVILIAVRQRNSERRSGRTV